MEGELDLPSGWRKIHDSSGTYYWHVPTGTTQWQHPSRTSGLGHAGEAACPETVLFDILSVLLLFTSSIIISPITINWHMTHMSPMMCHVIFDDMPGAA